MLCSRLTGRSGSGLKLSRADAGWSLLGAWSDGRTEAAREPVLDVVRDLELVADLLVWRGCNALVDVVVGGGRGVSEMVRSAMSMRLRLQLCGSVAKVVCMRADCLGLSCVAESPHKNEDVKCP